MRAGRLDRFANYEAIMRKDAVRVARIYLTEADHQLNEIIKYLHDNEAIAGATVFRGIEGYGSSGQLHDASLIDLSFDLPIMVEFFDESTKVLQAVKYLKEHFNISQAISWLAEQH